jgi:AraC family ethanolamine operon transcriptional activator
MSREISNIFVINQSFYDFDEFCVHTPAWNLDYRQLEAGAFKCGMLMVGHPDLLISRTHIMRRMMQTGEPPSHLRTFGLLANPDIEMYWRGRKVSGNQLFVFPRGAELDAVVEKNFDVYLFSVPEDRIDLSCELLGLPGLQKLLNGKDVFSSDPVALSSLRAYGLEIANSLKQGSIVFDMRNLQQIENEVCRLILTVVSTSKKEAYKKRQRLRDTGLQRVLTHLEESGAEDTSIQELCRVACVSERTLEYAFLERFSVTPKAYIRICRLNMVKKELLYADPSHGAICEIARQQGFWHSGQFSADYRRLFGELPSQVLGRGLGFGSTRISGPQYNRP